MQQGRVIIDSDLNEQSDIQYHFDTTLRQDIIGRAGTNYNDCGFGIEISEDEQCQKMIYKITKGKYYVDGILCENDKDVLGNDQPDLRSFHLMHNLDQATALYTGRYIAYLDVWDRHVNSINDPSIRESALGGSDTSTRTKIIWQIKLHKVMEDKNKIDENRKDNEENYDFLWAASILEKQFVKDKGRIAAGLLNLLDGNKHTKEGVYDGPNNVFI